MLKKLFSHTAIYGLAPQLPKVASVLSLPIITRYLTAVDFGVYGVITTIVGSIAVLATLGLNVILSNSFYKNPGQFKWAWRQIYGFLVLWNIPFAVLLSCIIFFFIPQEALEHKWLIIVLNITPIVMFGPAATIGGLYYQLKQKPMQIATRAIVFGLMGVGLNIYLIAGLKMGYMGWFWSIGVTQLLNHASYWWPINQKLGLKPIFNYKRRFIKQSLKIGLPTVPHYYSGYLLDSSDQAVMKILNVSTSNIGKYNAAYVVGRFVQQVGIAAGKAVAPMLNQSYKDKDEHTARQLIFILQTTFLCATFVLSIWLKGIFHILINNETLAQVYPLGIIIVMAYNYRPMYLGANNRLFYIEKTKVLLKVSFTAGILNLILNFALIKFVGYEVAAITTFAALMYMGYAGFFLKEFKEANTLNYYPLIWLSLTILLTAVAYFGVEFSVVIKAILSLAVLGGGLLFIKNINARK